MTFIQLLASRNIDGKMEVKHKDLTLCLNVCICLIFRLLNFIKEFERRFLSILVFCI
jgi:hypothetical protein